MATSETETEIETGTADLIKAARKDEAFLDDVAAHRGQPGFRLWWLGQSGYLLQWEARHLLIDPYLSDSLTEKYAETDKPHVRMVERVIDPAKLDFIDAVAVTHNHTDHLDPATLKPIMRANPGLPIVVPEGLRWLAARRLEAEPDQLVGADADGWTPAAGFRFRGIPAAHDSLETDDRGHHTMLGYVIAFDDFTVYHAGDTRWYHELAGYLQRHDIDVAILPINGYRPERRVAGNMWGDEAARLAHDVGAELAIPCHYNMFTFNTEPPDEFIDACDSLDQPCAVLECGQRIRVPPKA